MKVLMISGDKHLLEEGRDAYQRLGLQRSQVEQLDVYVWPQVHSAWTIWNAARKNHYDVVTAQDPFWRGLLGWKIKFWFGARLNLQVHADLAGQSLVKRTLALFLLKRADSVRVVSQMIKAKLPAHLRARISVLPIYIDIEHFKTIALMPHAGLKQILWVGRFEDEKNPSAAIEIFKQVQASGADAKLIMLGAGSLEKKLRAAAQDFPVEFPGWQDTPKYLATADVVVSTSKHESYGASIIEALAARVPVVAPDVGVAREAGAIVVPREKLAEAVIETLRTSARGDLKLRVLNAEEWAKAWKETLI